MPQRRSPAPNPDLLTAIPDRERSRGFRPEFMSNKLKPVKVKYIESGAFQGVEEDVFMANIEYGEECVVLSRKKWREFESTFRELTALSSVHVEQPQNMSETDFFNLRKAIITAKSILTKD